MWTSGHLYYTCGRFFVPAVPYLVFFVYSGIITLTTLGRRVCLSPHACLPCFFSFIRAQASELWVKGEKVTCGYISEDTRVRRVLKAVAWTCQSCTIRRPVVKIRHDNKCNIWITRGCNYWWRSTEWQTAL